MSIPSDLRSRVLELSEADRTELVYDLLLSLEPEGAEPDPDYEESWRIEIEERLRSIDEGRARLIPREEVEARLRDSIARIQQARSAPRDNGP